MDTKPMTSKQQTGVITDHLHAEILTTEEQFEEIREDWNRLFEMDADRGPFQSYAWLRACWNHRAPNTRLALIVVYENDRVIGIAPFQVKQRLPRVSQIEPIDLGHLTYFRPIAPPGRDDVVEAMAVKLASAFPAAVVHIPYFDARDWGTNVFLATLAVMGWGKESWLRNISHYICGPNGFEPYLALKSSKTRQNLKRWRNKLEQRGRVQYEHFTRDWINEHTVARMADIQRRSWLLRRGQPPINSPFNKELIMTLGREALAEVWILSLDGVDIAYILNLCTPDKSVLYYLAFDEQYAALAPGKVLMGLCIEETLKQGVVSYDFLFGEGEYKRFWANRTLCAMRAVGFKGLRGWLAAWLPHRLHGMLAQQRRLRQGVKLADMYYHKIIHRLRHGPAGDRPASIPLD